MDQPIAYLQTMKVMRVMRIGVMPQVKIRERLLKIAQGELMPKRTDPIVWFTSMRDLVKVLSDDNRQQLEIIRTNQPASVGKLAEIMGRINEYVLLHL